MKTGRMWTIGRRLTLSFLLVSVITAISSGVGYYAVTSGARSIDELGSVRLPSVDSLLAIKESQQNIRGTLRTLGIPALPPVIRSRQYDNLAKSSAQYENAWKVYEALPRTAQETELWKQFVPAWKDWSEDRARCIELCRQFDATGISNPVALAKSLELFRGDHYRACEQVLHMLHTKKPYEGGEDHTACNCGKWLPTFQSPNPDMAKTVQAIVEPHRRFHEAVKKIKQLVRDGQMDAAYAAYDQEMDGAAEEVFGHFRTLCQAADQAVTLLSRTQELLLGRLTDRQRAAEALLNNIVQVNRDAATAEAKTTHRQAVVFKTVSLVAGVVGVAAAMILGVLITRGINRNLTRISAQLNDGAEQVSDAANQISSTSQSLAQGAGEQASSLEETSSALEEMAAMTRTNAANAKEASELAGQARDAAGEGDKSMVRLNEAMTGINQSSDRISKIAKVIEEIAFQTNLLALNASVEAARAGEQGKGFAVVADEVRNLAQRAAHAAKETTGLIDGAVNSAQQGTQVAAEAGKSFLAIAASAASASNLIDGIAKASEEQAQGVEQVNIAVSQIDKVTQSNAAGAEESASASEELAAQAQTLKGMVGELVAMVGGGGTRSQKWPVTGEASTVTDGFDFRSMRRTRSGTRQGSRPGTIPGATRATESKPAFAVSESDVAEF